MNHDILITPYGVDESIAKGPFVIDKPSKLQLIIKAMLLPPPQVQSAFDQTLIPQLASNS